MSYHPPRRLSGLFVAAWVVVVLLQLGVLLSFTGAFLLTADGLRQPCTYGGPIGLDLWAIVALCAVGLLLLLQVLSFLLSFQVDTYCIQQRTSASAASASDPSKSSVYLAAGEYEAVPLAVSWPYPFTLGSVVLIAICFLFHVVWTVIGTLWFFDGASCMDGSLVAVFVAWFAVQYLSFLAIILMGVGMLAGGMCLIYYLLGRLEDLEAEKSGLL